MLETVTVLAITAAGAFAVYCFSYVVLAALQPRPPACTCEVTTSDGANVHVSAPDAQSVAVIVIAALGWTDEEDEGDAAAIEEELDESEAWKLGRDAAP